MSLRTLKLRVTAPFGTPVTKTLAEWGVVAGTLKLTSGGVDEMQLTFTRSYDQAPTFHEWSVVELLDVKGFRRFYGMALKPRQKQEAGQRRHVVRVLGPHFWMTRTTFVQTWMFVDDPDAEEVSESPNDVSGIILHRGTGERKALHVQLGEILAHAKASGAPIDWSFDNFPTIYLAEQTDRIVSDWQLFTQQVAFAPHVTTLWDYAIRPPTQYLPTMRFARSSGGSVVGPWTGKVVTPQMLAEAEIIPRDDLLCKTVKVCWVQKHSISQDNSMVTMRTVTVQESTAGPLDDGFRAFGTQVILIELRGASFDDGEVTQEPEAVPPGNLAAELHDAFLHLWYEFEFVVYGATLDWSWAIGQRVSLNGFSGELDAARTMVVGLTYDLANGKTTIQCGPPGRLVAGTIYDMIRPFRSNAGNFDKKNPDEGEEPNENPTNCVEMCKGEGSGGGVEGEGEGA